MSNLYYTCPLQAAYMSKEFGVKYIKDNFFDGTSVKFWQIEVDVSCFDNDANLRIWDKHNVKFYIPPDSLEIFDKMPFVQKRALMDLGMWPSGYEYMEIPLATKGWAKVDKEDYKVLAELTWGSSTKGYACRRVYLGHNKYVMEHMHRTVIDVPEHMLVDHINGDKSDNRKSNLRLATNSQNQMNRKPNKNSSSKYKGVSWHKRDKRWRASIGCEREKYHLGSFDTEEEAALAYNEGAKKMHGEYARLNQVKGPERKASE